MNTDRYLHQQHSIAAMDQPDLINERDLIHLFFCQTVVDLANKLKTNTNSESLIEKIAQKHVKILERCNSHSKTKVNLSSFRREVNEAFIALGYPDMVNVGDDVSDKHLVLM